MSTIKSGQISLYCHFNKIVESPGNKNTLKMFVVEHTSVLLNFVLNVTLLCSNAYDDVTYFEICGFHKNTKIMISRGQNIFSLNKKIH